MAGRRQRSRVPWVLLRLFSGRCAPPTREKSGIPPGSAYRPRPTVTVTRRVCGPAYGLENPQRSPFRSAVSFEERRGVGASRSPLREDGQGAYPTLFASKWLKSRLGDRLYVGVDQGDRPDLTLPPRA